MLSIDTYNTENILFEKLSRRSKNWLKYNPIPKPVNEVVEEYNFLETDNPAEQFCGHCQQIRRLKKKYKTNKNINSQIIVKSSIVQLDKKAPIYTYNVSEM